MGLFQLWEPAAFLEGGCFIQLPLPFEVQCHHLSTYHDLLLPGCGEGVFSLLVLIGFWLVWCRRNNPTGAQDPGCYIPIAERASNDRCFLLSLFLQLLGLFCFTHNRSLVCPCTVTWHFQVGEHVSSRCITNLALPTHPAAAWAKALSQFCWMHWHESLHSTTSIFPNIKIAFFVFHWQKWQSLFSV